MNKWRYLPRVSLTNYHKLYPCTSAFKRWFVFERYWHGRLIIIAVKHYAMKLDFRRDWVEDIKDDGKEETK